MIVGPRGSEGRTAWSSDGHTDRDGGGCIAGGIAGDRGQGVGPGRDSGGIPADRIAIGRVFRVEGGAIQLELNAQDADIVSGAGADRDRTRDGCPVEGSCHAHGGWGGIRGRLGRGRKGAGGAGLIAGGVKGGDAIGVSGRGGKARIQVIGAGGGAEGRPIAVHTIAGDSNVIRRGGPRQSNLGRSRPASPGAWPGCSGAWCRAGGRRRRRRGFLRYR